MPEGVAYPVGWAEAPKGGPPIYENLESYTRVFYFMPLAAWMWGVQTRRAWPVLLLLPALLLPCVALVDAWRNYHLVQQAGVMVVR